MPTKSNGDYFYVESETVNDLLDGFQIYDDGSGNLTLHDVSNDEEYKFNAGTGLQLPASRGVEVDGTQVLAGQQSLTDSTGGTSDGTLSAVSGSGADSAINNNFKELYDALAAHGLVA